MEQQTENQLLSLLSDYVNLEAKIGYEYKHKTLLKDNENAFHQIFTSDYNNNFYFLNIEKNNLRGPSTVKNLQENFNDQRQLYANFVRGLIEEWGNEITKNVDEQSIEQVIDKETIENQLSELENFDYEQYMTTIDYNELDEFLNQCLNNELTVKQTINEQLNKVWELLDKHDRLECSQGEKFVEAQKSDEQLTNFIGDKQKQEHQVGELTMSKAQGFQKVIFFDDNSFAAQTREGNWESPQFSADNYKETAKQIAHQYLDYKCRKKPKYKSAFEDGLQKSGYDVAGAFQALNAVLDNEAVLKAYKGEFLNDINVMMGSSPMTDFTEKLEMLDRKEPFRTFESISDYVDDCVYKHNVKKLARSIISNKYEHLYNDESFDYFKRLYEIKVSKEQLEQHVGSKLAAFETPDDLNKALRRFCNSLDDFEMENYLHKIENVNSEKVYADDELLIAKVNDYEASQLLGSAAWCISCHQFHFDSYTSGDNEQFFIYDFTKSPREKDSMIGITIENAGDDIKVTAMHYKDDDEVNDEQLRNDWKEIIKEHYEPFQKPESQRKNKPSL